MRSGDVAVAFRVDQKIEETLDDIAANPTIGHTRTDLGIPENLLVRAVYSYLVIYNSRTRLVRILRIWHGAQETPEIPETQGEKGGLNTAPARVDVPPSPEPPPTHRQPASPFSVSGFLFPVFCFTRRVKSTRCNTVPSG